MLTEAVKIPIGAIAPPPSPETTYANSTEMFANQDGFLASLTALQQRMIALDPGTTSYLVDFGTGANTSTGDTVFAALTKLQNWIAAVEAVANAPSFSGNPTISPASGDTSITYTAADPTILNGTITTRQWLLGTTVIGTGTTIVPGAGNTGQLTRKLTGTGTDGSTITSKSTAVTVAAAVPPVTISGTPGSATVGTAYLFTPTTSGGSGTKTFALTGTLPAGLSLNPTTGAINGTPTAAGTSSGLNVTVTDSSGSANLGSFAVTVSAATTPSTGILANGVWNDAATWDDTQSWKDAA
ncbi:Ig domain-containing protein [Sphingomonas sp. PAMC 26621]|uniref:Ig domain-containing protein n=1 Tax=Sphingomonas sp. PAMC 26621 TaxID=1112213 RepID=UPI0009DB5C3C|nr:Ig domain-containing protein [Sphingomonas sp. PAMC 26621]